MLRLRVLRAPGILYSVDWIQLLRLVGNPNGRGGVQEPTHTIYYSSKGTIFVCLVVFDPSKRIETPKLCTVVCSLEIPMKRVV